MQKITFSVNMYDSDGDIIEQGLYLHADNVAFKVATSLSEFDDVIEQLQRIRTEVSENYLDSQDLSK